MTADVPQRLRLTRSMRLQAGGDFARLKRQGRRVVQGCLIANWHAAAAPGTGRLGVVTSRKLGGAVMRSRARRLLREAWRRHAPELNSPADLVLVARNSIVELGYQEVERDFLAAMRRAGLMKA